MGWRVVQRPKEALVPEGSMPPAEKPTRRRRVGEQKHLWEYAEMAPGLAQGEEPGEHLREDAGQPGEVEREGEDKGLIGKAKTN